MEVLEIDRSRFASTLPLPSVGEPRGDWPAVERGVLTAWIGADGSLEVDPWCDPIGFEVAAVAAATRGAVARTAQAEARLVEVYVWGATQYASRAGAASERERRELGARAMLAELACALRMPEGTLAGRLTRLTMLDAFPRLSEAHRRGVVSGWHVDVVLDVFRGVSDPAVLARADAFVAERAERMTAPELRASARGWRSRNVPRSPEQRAVNLADRRVIITPADEDLVWLTALIPAAAGVAIDERLSALAKAARAEDGRTHQQLRADVLVDLLLDPAVATSGRPGASRAVTCEQTTSAGDGSEDASEPAEEGDEDRHAVAAEGDEAGGAFVDAGDERTAFGRAPVPGWVRGIRPELVLTVPVLTLLGQGDEPAELEGFGPIDIDTARVLAAGTPSFVRVLTHPETGAVLSVGRDRYRLPADLKRAVQLRDRTCRFPGCRRRARACDIDHSTAWQHGGESAACNLACLCRHHHRLKHLLVWQVAHRGDGVLDWTSPTGARYVTEPGSLWPPPPTPPPPPSPPPAPPPTTTDEPPTTTAGPAAARPGYPDVPPF